MTRMLGRLSAVRVQSVRKRGYYGDGGGLYLRVAPGGAKGWIFRYGGRGRRRDMGLGGDPAIGLAKARELAGDCRSALAAGLDPIAARNEKRAAAAVEAAKAMTFADCATAYINAHEAGWRNPKHRQQWKNTLATYVSPVVGKLPVSAVDTGLVLKVLEPIWTRKPETASRVRGRMEAVLDWAKVRGYRTGENPARWRGHLDHLLPAKAKVRKVEHHAALPYARIGAFLAALRKQDGISARALEFLVLTATRTGEPVVATSGRSPRCRSSCYCGAWVTGTSPRTASVRPSVTGRPSAPPSRARWRRWRSRTLSPTRWRRPTGAATCSTNAAS